MRQWSSYTRPMRLRAVLSLALLAAACVHVAPRPIAPAATAHQMESRSLADPALQQFVASHSDRQVPITRWDIDTLTLAAFYYHPEIDVARARAAVARAAIATAAERPNPSLTATVELKEADQGTSPWITTFGFDLPIETAGKRGLRVQQARELARSAELSIAQTAWQLRSAIRAEIVALASAGDAAAILRRQQAAQRDLLEALQRRLELGESSNVEVTTSRIAARQTDLLLRDRETQMAQARARLAGAVGVPGSTIGDVALEPAAVPSDAVSADLSERALTGRPDILAALADYAAAEADLRMQLARQYPDLHVAPGFGWDQGARRWSLGLTAEIPLLNQHRGPIGEAEARRSLSEAQFLALQNRILAALGEASVGYREAARKVSEAAGFVALQQRQFEAAQRSFNAGETDRVALRTAELELRSAELAHAEAIAQAQDAAGALENALEQPLTPHAMPQVPLSNPRAMQ